MVYENYREWKHWDSDSFGACPREDGIYFRAELAKCGLSGLAGAHILEFGFGNGKFAGWARNEGATYIGIEAIAELVSRGTAAGFDVHLASRSVHDIAANESLDLVVAFDVLEHLSREELEQQLRDVRDTLKLGGRLIARMPSGDSPFARAIQNGDLTHRLTLGSSAVQQIAALVGFTVDQCREPAFPLSGFGLPALVRRSAVKLGRALAYPILTKIFMGDGSPVLSPNMVFVLRKSEAASEPTLSSNRLPSAVRLA